MNAELENRKLGEALYDTTAFICSNYGKRMRQQGLFNDSVIYVPFAMKKYDNRANFEMHVRNLSADDHDEIRLYFPEIPEWVEDIPEQITSAASANGFENVECIHDNDREYFIRCYHDMDCDRYSRYATCYDDDEETRIHEGLVCYLVMLDWLVDRYGVR